MSINTWKHSVKRSIWHYQSSRWNATLIMYTKLSLYKHCISYESVWPWWQFSKQWPEYTYKCKVMLRLISGDHPLAAKQRKMGKTCPLCTYMVRADVPHILFKCTCQSLCDKRAELRSSIIQLCPPRLLHELDKMNVVTKTIFVLSGLGSSYIQEWSPLYKVLADFVFTIYNEYINQFTLIMEM